MYNYVDEVGLQQALEAVYGDMANLATKDDIPISMTGATSSSAGTSGLVPAPAKGAQLKFLRGDGTWQIPSGKDYTIQYGTYSGLIYNDTIKTVTFPTAFKTVPTVVATAVGNISSYGYFHIRSITKNDFSIVSYYTDIDGFTWIATGV